MITKRTMLTVSIEISPGELVDRITILEIKSERLVDLGKLANVRKELDMLVGARDSRVTASPELAVITKELREVNERLWDIEDEIRECERDKDFGGTFVELARSVYTQNDRRAALKRAINELLDSGLVEEKSYARY